MQTAHKNVQCLWISYNVYGQIHRFPIYRSNYSLCCVLRDDRIILNVYHLHKKAKLNISLHRTRSNATLQNKICARNGN